ncbi:MAG TPA: nucleoside transporter C-terminal domain-containing protein, partial [Longimicrobiales bacterium]|nr:nucleoside transporter C-terminal domain-containing protein [Longimicrobiales bacterium]
MAVFAAGADAAMASPAPAHTAPSAMAPPTHVETAAPTHVETAAPTHVATAAPAPAPSAASPSAPPPISSQATTPGAAAPPGTLPQRLRSLVGLVLLTLLAWALSTNRRVVSWRIVLWGLGLQLAFAFLVLRTPVGAAFFQGVSHAVDAVLHYAEEGAGFVFGDLIHNNVPVGPGEAGTNAPLEAQSEMVARTGAFFAFNVLPTIIFVSSLMTVLYHLGVMQWVVRGAAWVMRRTMGTTGAETLSAAANIFVGQLEAPLVVKPYVQRMTVSELNAVMAAGMATISGSTLAAYVGMLSGRFPDIAGHLIAASVMSAPAALVAAKLMVPETGEPETRDGVSIALESPDVNVIDAAARGAAEGLRLCLNIAAMIIAFLALVYMADGLVSWVGGLVGVEGLTLSGLVGMALRPVTWIVGVPWADAGEVGRLFGLKTVLNEFVAYLELAGILEGGAAGGVGLQPRSALLASYALAGFANFGSVAMLIGALGEMAPDRRHDLARVGLRAMVAG